MSRNGATCPIPCGPCTPPISMPLPFMCPHCVGGGSAPLLGAKGWHVDLVCMLPLHAKWRMGPASGFSTPPSLLAPMAHTQGRGGVLLPCLHVALACEPRGCLGFGHMPPRLPPWCIHEGRGAPLPCLHLPFMLPLHPNPRGALQVWVCPQFTCSLGTQGGMCFFPSTWLPVHMLPLHTNRGRVQGGGLICMSPLHAGQGGGGTPLLGVVPTTCHAHVTFGGRGVHKGGGAPSHSHVGTQRGGVCPFPLSQPLPPGFHTTPILCMW